MRARVENSFCIYRINKHFILIFLLHFLELLKYERSLVQNKNSFSFLFPLNCNQRNSKRTWIADVFKYVVMIVTLTSKTSDIISNKLNQKQNQYLIVIYHFYLNLLLFWEIAFLIYEMVVFWSRTSLDHALKINCCTVTLNMNIRKRRFVSKCVCASVYICVCVGYFLCLY